jgi:hypothetical protein
MYCIRSYLLYIHMFSVMSLINCQDLFVISVVLKFLPETLWMEESCVVDPHGF